MYLLIIINVELYIIQWCLYKKMFLMKLIIELVTKKKQWMKFVADHWDFDLLIW